MGEQLADETEPDPFGFMQRKRDGGDLRTGVEILLRQQARQHSRTGAAAYDVVEYRGLGIPNTSPIQATSQHPPSLESFRRV